MTPTKYFVALIAKAFGIERRNKRLADASSEMGLLREAEYELGTRVWQHIENVDELSVEYWNLRKMEKEHTELKDKLNELTDFINEAHVKRSSIIKEVSKEQQDAEIKRADLLHKLENVAYERDMIVRKAKEIRRTVDGLNTKMEVLLRDVGECEQIEQIRKQIAQAKDDFKELKKQRETIADELQKGDEEIEALDKEITTHVQKRRDDAAIVFQKSGEVNKELSQVRADLGNCEYQIRQLQSEIGRYVSRYAKRDPSLQDAVTQDRTLIEVMRMLRISIAYNHKLADFK